MKWVLMCFAVHSCFGVNNYQEAEFQSKERCEEMAAIANDKMKLTYATVEYYCEQKETEK